MAKHDKKKSKMKKSEDKHKEKGSVLDRLKEMGPPAPGGWDNMADDEDPDEKSKRIRKLLNKETDELKPAMPPTQIIGTN